jgi:hypothetical protein
MLQRAIFTALEDATRPELGSATDRVLWATVWTATTLAEVSVNAVDREMYVSRSFIVSQLQSAQF